MWERVRASRRFLRSFLGVVLLLSSFLFDVFAPVSGSGCVFTCDGSVARHRSVSSCQRDCVPSRLCSGNVSFLGYCFSSSTAESVYLNFWGELRPDLSAASALCPANVSATLSLTDLVIDAGTLCSTRCCERSIELASSALEVQLSDYRLLAELSLASSLPSSCAADTQFYFVLAGEGSFNEQVINQSMVVMYMPRSLTSCVYVLPVLSV